MNILSAESLSLEKGGKKLFENLSFGIDARSKIGLIGRNGSGKSSLLHLLANRDQPDIGNITTKTGTRIHLALQSPRFDPQDTIFSHLLSRDHILGDVLRRYQDACQRMEHDKSEESHRELDAAMAEMHARDGWKYEGWVVVDGTPVTSGKFTDVAMADESAPYSGSMSGPPFPGEDYLMNAPMGLTFPTDLAGQTAVISVEPEPDDTEAPFTLKPLTGMIPMDATDHMVYDMDTNTGSLPTGTATIQ